MFNTKVTKKTGGVMGLPETPVSEGVARSNFFADRRKAREAKALELEASQSIVTEAAQMQRERVLARQTLESQMPQLLNQITTKGRNVICQDILRETFIEALYLDKPFVEQNSAALEAELEGYLNKMGGAYTVLENAIQRTQSPFLKRIKAVCEATTRKVTTRKAQELSKDGEPDQIDFSLTHEEQVDYEYDKSELGLEQVAEIVKKKTLQAVVDEKERQKKEESFENEISDMKAEAEASSDDEDTSADDAPTKESSIFKSIFESDTEEDDDEVVEDDDLDDELEASKETTVRVLDLNPHVRESTLFGSIMEATAKTIITESVAGATGTVDDDDDDNPQDYNTSMSVNDLRGDTVHDEQDDHPVVGTNIDMDLILAESITKYTLLETMHTLQLEEFSYDKLQKQSRALLAGK